MTRLGRPASRMALLLWMALVVTAPAGDGTAARASAPTHGTVAEFYPLAPGCWWLYDVRVKEEQGVRREEVKCLVEGEEEIDGRSYSVFLIAGGDFRMFIRRDDKGVYLCKWRFPVPQLDVNMEVDFEPEIPFIRFPLAPGGWHYRGRAEVWEFGADLRIDYENLGRQLLQTPAGEMDCYHFRSRVRYWKIDYSEEYWYARGVGFVKGVNDKNPEVILDYHIND